MTLFLVRHGRASAGIEELEPGLDDIGHSQAEHAAIALKKVGAVRLVSSPLKRTRETAAPIARELGLPIEICEGVAEVFVPSATPEERATQLGPLLSGLWSKQTPELRAWRDRVLFALMELGRERIIVVSHFVAISAAIGASTEDDRVSPCALANASITTMDVVGDKLVLRRPGEVAHLSRDEITATHAPIPRRG
jgi:broad specificity phosphatase PhoE